MTSGIDESRLGVVSRRVLRRSRMLRKRVINARALAGRCLGCLLRQAVSSASKSASR